MLKNVKILVNVEVNINNKKGKNYILELVILIILLIINVLSLFEIGDFFDYMKNDKEVNTHTAKWRFKVSIEY